MISRGEKYKFMRFKILLMSLTLLTATVQGQVNLVKDSWHNAGHWFKAESYSYNDALYWGLGAGLVAFTFTQDAEWQAAWQTNASDDLGPIFEPMGNPLYMGTLGLGAYTIGLISENEELEGLSSVALQSMLTSGALVMALKLAFHRERPEEQLSLDPYRFNGPSFSRDNLSFPSGHSVIAFSAAASISRYYGDIWYVSLPLYTAAGLTAWQRVFDQKHWPSDVLTGALIGIFVGRKIAHWHLQDEDRVTIGTALLPNSRLGLALKIKLD